jgi:hypothetical protein
MSNPSPTYEYRFVAARGVERKLRNSASGDRTYSIQQALNGQPTVPPKLWHPVKGEHFLEMTWEELEHVAHVIRDASRPSQMERAS